MMIIITNKGFRGNGIYIGRPSPYGNPFPVKKSKYGKGKVYSLRKSLRRYAELILSGKIDISNLVGEYRRSRWTTQDGQNRSRVEIYAGRVRFIDIPKQETQEPEPPEEEVEEDIPF